MRKYFGTDGIRRIANTELSPELVYKVAKAGAYVLSKHTDHIPTILIGRDTRISGTLIESAMVAGFLSYGANVKLLGVIPTPAVAYLTRKLNADAGVVISASHNTYEFNGIKYFSNKGMKIPDTLEEEIEEVMESGKLDKLTAVNEKIGVSEYCLDLVNEYIYFFRKNFDDNLEQYPKDNFVVGLDTANGATYQVAEKIFKALGIPYKIINNQPDGININQNCGSTHLEGLKKFVVENHLSLGVAYDGDGDRCLAIDEKGNEIDGDKLLAIISQNLRKKAKLKKADERDLETKIKGFVHDYIYKLSNVFLIPFFSLIISGLIAYHSYMTSQISEIYSEIYQTRAQADVLLHRKIEDRQEYIDTLEDRIMKLEHELYDLREENINLRQQPTKERYER